MSDIKPIPDEVVEEWLKQLNWSSEATDYHKTLVSGNVRAFASYVNRRLDLQGRIETLERLVSDFT